MPESLFRHEDTDIRKLTVETPQPKEKRDVRDELTKADLQEFYRLVTDHLKYKEWAELFRDWEALRNLSPETASNVQFTAADWRNFEDYVKTLIEDEYWYSLIAISRAKAIRPDQFATLPLFTQAIKTNLTNRVRQHIIDSPTTFLSNLTSANSLRRLFPDLDPESFIPADYWTEIVTNLNSPHSLYVSILAELRALSPQRYRSLSIDRSAVEKEHRELRGALEEKRTDNYALTIANDLRIIEAAEIRVTERGIEFIDKDPYRQSRQEELPEQRKY